MKTKLLEAEPYERWGPLEYLLADLCDWMQYNALVGAYKGTKSNMPKLKPIHRPTDVQRAKELQDRQRAETYERFMQVKALVDSARETTLNTPEVPGPSPEEA